jgi:hypothetical protein
MILREALLKYKELAFSYPADPPYEINDLLEQLRAKGYAPRLEQFVGTSGHTVYCAIWVKQESPAPAPLVGDPPTAEEWDEAFKNTRPGTLRPWPASKQVWDKDRFPDVGEPDNFVEEFRKARSRFEQDEQLRKDNPDEFQAKFDAQEDGE